MLSEDFVINGESEKIISEPEKPRKRTCCVGFVSVRFVTVGIVWLLYLVDRMITGKMNISDGGTNFCDRNHDFLCDCGKAKLAIFPFRAERISSES